MTNAELLDLLREARDVCEYPEFIPSSGNISHARQVRARIDAALAERQDKPPCSCGQPYPCMKGCPDCCHSQGYLDYCDCGARWNVEDPMIVQVIKTHACKESP
jgi:hypothetical protein